MRKLALAAVLASTMMATPALARNDSWYIGADAGPMLVENINFDVKNAGAWVPNAVTSRHKAGYDVDGVIGYDFGGFRLEAEVAYKQAVVRGIRSSIGLPETAGGAMAPAGDRSYAGGKTSALSFMVNGLLDFGEDDGVQGYVGAGAGVARVKFAKHALNTITPWLNDSDTGFAWQALAGLRAPLSDNWDVNLQYRFFNEDGVNVIDQVSRPVHTRFRSHSLLGGLRYNFGGAPVPPPPVVAPPPPPVETPPPPPPAAAVCQPGPYIVFFEWDKSDITPEAASILDNAVTAYGDCGHAQVMLAGYTDTSGSAKYNLGLSQRRADSVAAYMTSKGIPGGVISTKAYGETNLRVQTADGVRELQNRRVEITYGPGSGN